MAYRVRIYIANCGMIHARSETEPVEVFDSRGLRMNLNWAPTSGTDSDTVGSIDWSRRDIIVSWRQEAPPKAPKEKAAPKVPPKAKPLKTPPRAAAAPLALPEAKARVLGYLEDVGVSTTRELLSATGCRHAKLKLALDSLIYEGKITEEQIGRKLQYSLRPFPSTDLRA